MDYMVKVLSSRMECFAQVRLGTSVSPTSGGINDAKKVNPCQIGGLKLGGGRSNDFRKQSPLRVEFSLIVSRSIS